MAKNNIYLTKNSDSFVWWFGKWLYFWAIFHKNRKQNN